MFKATPNNNVTEGRPPEAPLLPCVAELQPFYLPSQLRGKRESYLTTLLAEGRPQEALGLVEVLLSRGYNPGDRILRLYALGASLAWQLGDEIKAKDFLCRAVAMNDHNCLNSPLRWHLREQLEEIEKSPSFHGDSVTGQTFSAPLTWILFEDLADSVQTLRYEAAAAETKGQLYKAVALRAYALRTVAAEQVSDSDQLPALAEEVQRSQSFLAASPLSPFEKCRFLLDAARLYRQLDLNDALEQTLGPLQALLSDATAINRFSDRQKFDTCCAAAELFSYLGAPQDALPYWQKAQLIAQNIPSVTPNALGGIHLGIADALVALQRPLDAYREIGRGLKLSASRRLNDPDLAATLWQQALVLALELHKSAAVQNFSAHFKKALADREKVVAPELAGTLAFNTGSSFLALNRCDEAGSFYRLSAACYRRSGPDGVVTAVEADFEAICCQLRSGADKAAAQDSVYLARQIGESSGPAAVAGAQWLILLGGELLDRGFEPEGRSCLESAQNASQQNYKADPIGHAQNCVQLALFSAAGDKIRPQELLYDALATLHDFADQDSTTIKLQALQILSTELLNAGLYAKVDVLFSQGEALRQRAGLAETDPALLGLELNRLRYLNQRGDRKEALIRVKALLTAVEQAALEPDTRLKPENEIQLLICQGSLLLGEGNYAEAEVALRAAAERARRHELTEGPLYAIIQLNRGINLANWAQSPESHYGNINSTAQSESCREQLNAAMDCLKEAYFYFQQHPQLHSCELSATYNACADIFETQGELGRAQSYRREAAALKR